MPDTVEFSYRDGADNTIYVEITRDPKNNNLTIKFKTLDKASGVVVSTKPDPEANAARYHHGKAEKPQVGTNTDVLGSGTQAGQTGFKVYSPTKPTKTDIPTIDLVVNGSSARSVNITEKEQKNIEAELAKLGLPT